jgi:glucose-1-phosphate adenylyltransferase
MLRRSVTVERSARLEHCIIMERSRIGRGAQVRRAIIDQDNDVPPLETIGLDLEKDRQRFHVSEGGIVVVPAGYFPPRTDGARSAAEAARIGEAVGHEMEALA